MTERKKAGIRDIAAEAGVSTTTVSYVLNKVEGKSISPETRERIIAAAKKLNYTPNAAARLLRTGRTQIVSVRLTASLSTAHYSGMAEGIRRRLEEQGYGMLMFTDRPAGNSADYIEACLAARADGILYIASDRRDIEPARLAYIREHKIPLSVIDCMGEEAELSTVLQDYAAASTLRLQYLLERGVKRFAYVGGSGTDVKDDIRLAGFRGFLEERGLPYEVRRFSTKFRTLMALNDDAPSHFDMPHDVRTATSLPYHLEPQDFRALREIIYSLPNDVGILAAYPPLQDAVSHVLCARHYELQEAETVPWYERTVSYAFPHYDIGYEAAGSLLELMQGGAPRKLLIQPQILPVDPVYY